MLQINFEYGVCLRNIIWKHIHWGSRVLVGKAVKTLPKKINFIFRTQLRKNIAGILHLWNKFRRYKMHSPTDFIGENPVSVDVEKKV